MLDPRDHHPDTLTRAVDDVVPGLDPAVARRWTTAVVGRGVIDPARWGREFQIPRRLTDRVGPLPRLVLDRVVTSPIDGFRKLRFLTGDGLAIETVLIPLQVAGRMSVCLSSQVGCAMGCVFCATATMPVRRNLATWEIVDQYLQARELAGEAGCRISGAVFMGMGEPFLPTVKPRVLAAAALLSSPHGGGVAAKSITISTVGIVPSIDEYTEERHKFRLSISLGAATDALRARLVPVASRWPIAEVMAAARRHAASRRDRVMLAYVCISGLNVSESDAEALGQVIGDTPVRLDLIDVTDPSGRFLPPTADEMRRFRDALTHHVGQPVVRRYSGGKDILAACGTLAGSDADSSGRSGR